MRYEVLSGIALLCLACGGSGARGPGTAEPEPSPSPARADPEPPPVEPAPAPRRAPAPGQPVDYVEMEALGTAPVGGGTSAVVLADRERTVLIPIFVGGTEGTSIEHRLRGQPFARPLTHDLVDSILGELNAELVQVQIDELRGGVYVGSVWVRDTHRIIEIDARSSDAVALAIGAKVPIYVAQAVIDNAGVPADSAAARPYEMLLSGPIDPAELAERIDQLADEACACTDARCGEQVQGALSVLISNAGTPPAADQKAITGSLQRMGVCLQKLAPSP